MEHENGTAETPSAARRYLVLTAKLAVSSGLLLLLLSRMDTSRFWSYARKASPLWLGAALAIYALVVLVSAWRWLLLLRAQKVVVPGSRLVASYLVANFFNNFLPSNIGGDVIRIKDTAAEAGSKTLATTIVLVDRGIGLMGLVLVAALGSSGIAGLSEPTGQAALPIVPWMLWLCFAVGAGVSAPALMAPSGVGRLLQPLRVFHREWVETRILRITDALARFREDPRALAGCFVGAVIVQTLLVGFYVAIGHSMRIPVSPWHLAVIVPISFVVQMLPLSINGFGVREAVFSFYFAQFGFGVDAGVALSLVSAALIMLFSLSGGLLFLARRRGSRPSPAGDPA